VSFDKLINKVMSENSLKGGNADKYTPQSIAKLHNVPVESILYQIAMGIKVELEHTNDKEKARKVAMDHLVEIPDYYDRLKKMEKEADIEEMTNAGVLGTSGYETGGIAPQDNIPYAKGDSRVPKVLFTKGYKPGRKKKNKKKRKMHIQRRPKIGM